MSEENVEVVRRAFDVFQRGGPEAMLVELFSDDVVTYRHDPDGATLHGKAGFPQGGGVDALNFLNLEYRATSSRKNSCSS